MRERFSMVVACDLNRGIGKNNSLPWRIPGDLKHFKDLTTKTSDPNLYNACIMGRKTWESIPANHRPLPGRYNIVLTRKAALDGPVPQGVFVFGSLDDALEKMKDGPIDQVFVIGGAEIYNQAIIHERMGALYLTEVRSQFDCDTFFPEYKEMFNLKSSSEIMVENGIEYVFKEYLPFIPEV